MDGGTAMTRSPRDVERRVVLRRDLSAFTMTDSEAGAIMDAAAELPATLRPAQLTPFGPQAALSAAAAWERERDRRLSRDSLVALYEREAITATELRAGRELALLIEWRQGAHTPLGRTGGYMERLAASTGMDTIPFGVLMAEIESTRWVPWRAWCERFPPVKAQPRVGIEVLVELVVCGNKGVRQAADALRVDQRRALALLRRALERYAVVAGWLTADTNVKAMR